jgi:hypothetical protein
MGDLSGDGHVDYVDRDLLLRALGSQDRPAAWNRLDSRAAREDWASRAFDLDLTNSHTPYAYWNQCLGFSTQTFLNFSHYGGDLFATYYSTGSTTFNLPLYTTIVTAPGFGHGINAILVGDDPLEFDDWLFVEPQTDEVVRPGMWDMPFDSELWISVPEMIYQGGLNLVVLVKFTVSVAGGALLDYSPNLALSREEAPLAAPPDHAQLWNPFVIPHSNGTLLVGTSRWDFSTGRHDDLFVSSFLTPTQTSSNPLIGLGDYSRLLDVTRDSQGQIHLLWVGKEESLPGVFYGQLDLAHQRVVGMRRLSDGARSVHMGRILVAADGSLHAFWLELQSNVSHPFPSGVYWTSNIGAGWRPAENLAPRPFRSLFDTSNWWDSPDVLRYYFDVTPLPGGKLLLAWNEPKFAPNVDNNKFVVRTRILDGTWEPPALLAPNAGSAGVALAADADDRVHLIYSAGTDRIGNRGMILHRVTSDGRIWSEPLRVDSGGQACCPRLFGDAVGNVFVTFMERSANQERGFWRLFDQEHWSPAQALDGNGKEIWYPTISESADGETVAVWSSRSRGMITIGSEHLRLAETPPPEPPGGPWLSPTEIPGFEVKVRIESDATSISGTPVDYCIPETLCIAGAIADRAEVFVRVVGPKPNGKLWPTLVKFSTSRVEIWLRQTGSGAIRYYDLPPAAASETDLILNGLADRFGFDPEAALWPPAAPLINDWSYGRSLSKASGPPEPPGSEWLVAPEVPGFRVKIRFSSGDGSVAGEKVEECIAETLCVSGSVRERAEVFVRVVGPKPNGRLWPTLVRFSTSRIEIWIEQVSSGIVAYYDLPAPEAGQQILSLDGLADRAGFAP